MNHTTLISAYPCVLSAIYAQAPAASVFLAGTLANLVPRAVKHHQWYRDNFEDYPPQRRAIFPGVL